MSKFRTTITLEVLTPSPIDGLLGAPQGVLEQILAWGGEEGIPRIFTLAANEEEISDEEMRGALLSRGEEADYFDETCPECPQFGAGYPIRLDEIPHHPGMVRRPGATCPNCGRRWIGWDGNKKKENTA